MIRDETTPKPQILNAGFLISPGSNFQAFQALTIPENQTTINMKNLLLSAAVAAFCFSSCKKDNNSPARGHHSLGTTNYFPLSAGSYWVYEQVSIDTNGVETFMESDSLYNVGDTVINGFTYTKQLAYHDNGMVVIGAVRDSANGCIINGYGNLLFSEYNSTDTLQRWTVPGFLYGTYRMTETPEAVWTPAGTFIAKDLKGTFTYVSTWPYTNPRYTHEYYADGVGMVKQTFFFAGDPRSNIHRRLIRYHIE